MGTEYKSGDSFANQVICITMKDSKWSAFVNPTGPQSVVNLRPFLSRSLFILSVLGDRLWGSDVSALPSSSAPGGLVLDLG